MRKITKTHQPVSLRDWRDENKDIDHDYRALLGSQAHIDLKQLLIAEQGSLCAYTGRRIDSTTCHVEHVKPQNRCVGWEDVEYKNVVACFPADGGDTSYGYGAPIKAGWWNQQEFISPLSHDCERRFSFVWSGKIKANLNDHVAANTTIEVIQLDNDSLTKLRKARINAFFGFSAKSKPLSVVDAQAALANIDKKDSDGKLSEFCFVLKQLLPKYIAAGGTPK